MARTLVGEAIVKLRLVDNLTKGTDKATASLKALQAAANALGTGPKLNVFGGSLQAMAREAGTLRAALAGLQVPTSVVPELRRLTAAGRGLSRLTSDVNAINGALKGLGTGITGNLGLDSLRRQIAALGQEIRRFNSTPGGSGPPGSRPPLLRPGMGVPGGHTAAQAVGYQGPGIAINRAGRTGVTAGFELQRQNTLDMQAGLSPEESRTLNRWAIEGSRRRMGVDVPTLRDIYREGFIGMGGREGGGLAKLDQLRDEVADSIIQMMTRYGPERAREQYRKLFRSIDVLDRNDNPEVMRELIRGFTRAQGVEGAEFNYADLFNAARYSKSAGQALSNRFLYTELPVIMGDVGGSRAGTELGSLYAQLIGNRSSEKAKEEQRRLGIRDDSGVIGREMMSDPGEWARKILMPGLQRSGVDINNPGQVVEAVNKMVSNQVVAAMLARAITQRDRIRERQQQYDLAPSGPEGADAVERMDGRMAANAVAAQFRNLLGSVFDPILEELKPAFRNAATTLNEWAEQVRASPEAVKEAARNFAGTIGGIAITLGGLKLASIVATAAAGPALLRSAGALTAAAAALKASGGPGGLPIPRGPGGAVATAGGAAAAGGIGATMMRFLPGVGWVLGGAALGYGAGRAIDEVGKVAGGAYWTPKDQEEVEGYKARIAELQERLAGIESRTHPSMRGQPNAERANIESTIADLQNRVAAAERGFETGGSFGQAGHQTGEAFTANMAQGVAAGAPNVLQQMEALMQQLKAKAAEGVTINIRGSVMPGTSGEPPGRALGGAVTAGQLYTVGEAGPELFSPGANGSIIPNHANAASPVSQDGRSGGGRYQGSRTINVSLSGPLIGSVAGLSVNEIATQLASKVSDMIGDRLASDLRGGFFDGEETWG